MQKQSLKFYSLILFLVFPSIGLAQTFSLEDSTFSGVINEIISVLNILRPILFGLAFIVFFWGLSQFILHSDNKASVENGKKYMFWGVIALFVLVSFMAIITFVAKDLELGTPSIPSVLLPTD